MNYLQLIHELGILKYEAKLLKVIQFKITRDLTCTQITFIIFVNFIASGERVLYLQNVVQFILFFI